MSEVNSISPIEIITANDFIDAVEYAMVNEMVESGEFVLIQAPLHHEFAGGMYIRTITMPAGSRFTTLVHKYQHPFFISKGKVIVLSENDGQQLLGTGHKGITLSGTRRVLKVLEETIWTTVHRTDIVPEDESEEAIEKAANLVIDEITQEYENPLLGGHYRNSIFFESKLLDKTKSVSEVY